MAYTPEKQQNAVGKLSDADLNLIGATCGNGLEFCADFDMDLGRNDGGGCQASDRIP